MEQFQRNMNMNANIPPHPTPRHDQRNIISVTWTWTWTSHPTPPYSIIKKKTGISIFHFHFQGIKGQSLPPKHLIGIQKTCQGCRPWKSGSQVAPSRSWLQSSSASQTHCTRDKSGSPWLRQLPLALRRLISSIKDPANAEQKAGGYSFKQNKKTQQKDNETPRRPAAPMVTSLMVHHHFPTFSHIFSMKWPFRR